MLLPPVSGRRDQLARGGPLHVYIWGCARLVRLHARCCGGRGDALACHLAPQWHRAVNTGVAPVKLLVIDLVEKSQSNVIVRK